MRKKQFYFLLIITALLICTGGVTLYKFNEEIIDQDKQLSELSEVYESLEGIRIKLRSAIIHQRDFIITGNVNFYNDYQQEKIEVAHEISDFSKTKYDIFLEPFLIDSLIELVDIKFMYLDSLIYIDSLNKADNVDYIIENLSTQVMDKITSINKHLEGKMEALTAEFRKNTSADAKLSTLIIAGTYSTAVLLLIISLFNLWKQIATRIKTEKELRDNQEELKELSLVKDKFFSIIAHDLRGPFNVLLNLSFLMNQAAKNEDLKKVLEITSKLEALSGKTFNLLNNLLEWSRIQTGSFSFTPSSFSCKKIIHDNLSLLEENIQQKAINVHFDEDDVIASGDHNMINTVVRNILSNAVKFTPEYGNIEIDLHSEANEIRLIVCDDGPGLLDKEYSLLFRSEIDTRNIGPGPGKGSGLGLIICKEFIEKHGGKMIARPSHLGGSCFGFTIPLTNGN